MRNIVGFGDLLASIRVFIGLILVATLLGAAPPLAAQDERPSRWGLSTSLGTGSAGGDLGDLLEKPVSAELNLFRTRGPWRFGFGLSFTSFTMASPYEDEPEWGFQRTYLQATRMLRTKGTVLPYLQLRGGLARLHPRSELFAFSPPPEEPGDSPTTPANGFSLGLVPGVEFRLNKSLALDVSGHFDWFNVSDYDLSPVGYPNAGAGTAWEARVGLRWYPDNGWGPGPAKAGSPDLKRDAWGVSKNLGWAVAETLAINLGASGFNEYVRNANFNQISPRSWWANLEHGLTYDDNEFRTNQYIHPFNGSTYYNSGRANGFGFWEASLFALGGAFFWECCGETHPMSFNDLVSTGLGGIAFGEQAFRLSSELLDNQDTGKSRFFREFGSFLINPIRGLNRTVSGRAKTVHDNPEEPLDFRPPHARFFVFTGVRTIGEGESISENTNTYGLIGMNHSFGSVFDNARRRPFDSFGATYVFSPGEKQPRTVLQIRGDLWSKPLGGGTTPTYALAIVQHFDYHNNTAYEFGGQSFGPSLFARYKLSDKMSLGLRLDAMASVLAAVNSDYAFLAEVPDRERYREYDYGPGLGTIVEAHLNRGGHNLLSLYYRYHWIDIRNGSLFNQVDESQEVGSNASHHIQMAGARLFLPLFKRMGLGADGFVLLRRSYYADPLLVDKDQRNPEARVYLAWDLGRY